MQQIIYVYNVEIIDAKFIDARTNAQKDQAVFAFLFTVFG